MSTKKAVSGKVSVVFARLTSPLATYNIAKGTLLTAFLQRRGVEFNNSVRVNGKVVTQKYVVKQGDIISQLEQVSGGK
jgi:hypothetical protein